MKLKQLNRIDLLFLAFLLLLFWYKTFVFDDPDFWWRLTSGNIYATYGIPSTDIFTYTMPSFPWVDHAWSISYAIAYLEKHLGHLATAFIFSLIAAVALTASFLWKLDLRVKKRKSQSSNFYNIGLIGLAPLILAIDPFLAPLGIRAQVISWLLYAVIIKLIFDKKLLSRYKYTFPIIFLAWANVHGSFTLGLLSVIVVFFFNSFKIMPLLDLSNINISNIKRTISVKNILAQLNWQVVAVNFTIITLSIAATFINPYGGEVWREVWSSVSDSSLRFEIIEWTPVFFTFRPITLIFITLSVIFTSLYYKKLRIDYLILFTFMSYEAFLSKRHMPLWTLLAAPGLMVTFDMFWEETAKSKIANFRLKKGYKVIYLISVTLLVLQSYFVISGAASFNEEGFFPKDAVAHIRSNMPDGNIFAFYGWGGYLINKLPEKKTFVDGRMPSWNWNKHPDTELSDAFSDYNDILRGEVGYEDYFKRYTIDTVLFPKEQDPGLYDYLNIKLTKFMIQAGLKKEKDEENFNLKEELLKNGWVLSYQDNVSEILSFVNN